VRLAFVVIAILAVPSKQVPPIVRAVVSLGAETIVITGVVVVVATVASELAEVTDVTVPEPPPAKKVGADVPPALVSTVPLAHNATAVYTQVLSLYSTELLAIQLSSHTMTSSEAVSCVAVLLICGKVRKSLEN